jgi:hypothetical protein
VLNKAGEVCAVLSRALPATVFGSLFNKVGAAVQIQINAIHNFIMIFMGYIYKYSPTYRLTVSGYPTRETIYQIGVAPPKQFSTVTCTADRT